MRRSALALLALAATTLASAQAPIPANVAASIAKADAALARLLAIPEGGRTFDNTVRALDDLTDDLNAETSMTVFMQNVSPDAAVRDGSRAAEDALNDWAIALGKNEAVFKALQAVPDGGLEPVQSRLLRFSLRDYRRSGMALSPEKRTRLAEIERTLAKDQQQFATNIAEDATLLAFTKKELEGVPASRLASYKRSGDLTMIPVGESTVMTVLTFAKDPETRHKFQLAYNRRGGKKNVDLLEATLKLRAEQAALLGYATPAAYETEPRMAGNAEAVAAFYRTLQPLARRKAQQDYAEFLALKKQDVKGATSLERWDVNYYRNVLKTTKYKVDGEKIAEYFPSDATFKGLLSVASTLYDIEFRDVTASAKDLWHPDVKKVQVWDKATKGQLGTMYFDLFPRPNKYTHAACWGLVGHRVNPDGTVQLPVSALVCNFTPPSEGKPSLLPHDEVETLFHEFGHGLHNMFGESKYARFAGTGVERDFVEAPSQMFENWVWDPKVLATFARHYKTGETLPEKTLKAMIAAKNVGSGLDTEGQEVLGLVDQRYHTAPGGVVDTTKVWYDTQREASLLPPVEGTWPQASFGHLMGGYQAGYYGYLWSKVYGQDMFGRFEEKGLLNPEAGAYYRAHILAKGGTMDAKDLVREYLGREPSQEAFLKELGLTTGK